MEINKILTNSSAGQQPTNITRRSWKVWTVLSFKSQLLPKILAIDMSWRAKGSYCLLLRWNCVEHSKSILGLTLETATEGSSTLRSVFFYLSISAEKVFSHRYVQPNDVSTSMMTIFFLDWIQNPESAFEIIAVFKVRPLDRWLSDGADRCKQTHMGWHHSDGKHPWVVSTSLLNRENLTYGLRGGPGGVVTWPSVSKH